ncbi:MAG: hypothetical protein IPL43_02500 [Micropruina sp.]|nr:hypothetical protein [Micropruina sp.]
MTISVVAVRPPSPVELGVGMRLSIHPHCDNYVEVILGALADLAADGLTESLEITTDELGTHVTALTFPAEQRLADYLLGLIRAAHRRSDGGHVVAHVLLSRGCPGEVRCDLTATGLTAATPIVLPPAWIAATAAWSLYPMTDGEPSIDVIYGAIEGACARGTVRDGMHFATRLSGDLADVVATGFEAWSRVGASVAHVVTHLTLSVGSPTVEHPSPKE